MKRLTRVKDQYECRIAGGCPAEEWIEDITGIISNSWLQDYEYKCETCPFEKYINRLADFEDENEYMEDDKK